MAAGPPKILRSTSERIVIFSPIVYGTYYHSDGDLTSITGGKENTNYAGTKADGDSTSHLGTINNTGATSSPPSIRNRSYLVPQTSDYKLLGNQRSQISQRLSVTLAEDKHIWLAEAGVRTSSAEDTIAPIVIIESGGDKDNWGNEETEEEEEKEDEEGREEDEVQDDWLEMSRKASWSEPTDNATVKHSKQPTHTSNTWLLNPGRVITILNNEDLHLSTRTMVVMAKSAELTLQCVSLCSHPGEDPNAVNQSPPAHVRVYAGSTNAIQDTQTSVVINFDSNNSKLVDDCWINCQHVWSVRNNVKYIIEGQVKDMTGFLDHFCAIQRQFYDDVRASLPGQRAR